MTYVLFLVPISGLSGGGAARDRGGVETTGEEPAGGKADEGSRRDEIKGKELAGEKDDADDPETKEALATLLETDKHHFRLRGIRVRQLSGRQTRQPSIESYGVNIQTGMIPGSTKTICGCQCRGPLMSDFFKAFVPPSRKGPRLSPSHAM